MVRQVAATQTEDSSREEGKIGAEDKVAFEVEEAENVRDAVLSSESNRLYSQRRFAARCCCDSCSDEEESMVAAANGRRSLVARRVSSVSERSRTTAEEEDETLAQDITDGGDGG
ncbi:hypothetical protein BHE74_00005449 [Ensete ventricosum]|nr:hypothetical protein BHE74_00005449 [Ensete ventricosum]